MPNGCISDLERDVYLPKLKPQKEHDIVSIVNLIRSQRDIRRKSDCHTSLYFDVVLNWLEAETGYLPF